MVGLDQLSELALELDDLGPRREPTGSQHSRGRVASLFADLRHRERNSQLSFGVDCERAPWAPDRSDSISLLMPFSGSFSRSSTANRGIGFSASSVLTARAGL